MKPSASLIALVAATSLSLASAILVQPNNYMLDDSAFVGQQDGGSLSPFYNDQSGASEHGSDKDIVSIFDRLAAVKAWNRYARMLDNQEQESQLSQEMADLIQSESQAASSGKESQHQQEPSLSSSMASMLLNVAQAATQGSAEAAAAAAAHDDQSESGHTGGSGAQSGSEPVMSSRGQIVEMDTSQSSAGSVSMPSKADLKTGTPRQWYNPKETIPVLKISSMGTGSSSAPPSPLQDGVIDFLKKFRDVYIQTRPVNSGSGSSAANLASSVVSAAASSPFASFVVPSSSGSRPNLASALSAASSMVAQATSSSSSGSSQASSTGTGAASAAAGSATNAAKPSALSAQSYVSFWSKTFPTWVRKTLKQLRRRSLYNSSKRQQQKHHHQHHHSASSAIGQAAQAAASGAVASVVDQATSGSSSSSSASQSSSH